MYYVYMLKNVESGELYYGYTNNLDRRLKEHNKDNDWKLIYFEGYLSELDARQREKRLKQYGQARAHLKNRLKNSVSV